MTQELTIVSAASVPGAAICDAYNAAFADYVIPFPLLDPDSWSAVTRRQGVDLALSLAACRGDSVVAFSLVTPRGGGITRVATMGARPAERGSGVAKALLDRTLAAARGRGDTWAELEVFAQNPRALSLYRSRGFAPACSLFGYEAARGPGQNLDIIEVAREDAVTWARAAERDDGTPLPWQVTGAAIACAPQSLRVWRLGNAQISFVEGGGAVSLTSVLDRAGDYADAERLLGVFRARFPDHVLRAPQLQRDTGPAAAFERAGWTRSALYQHLMRCAL